MVLADLIKSHGLDQKSLSKLTGYSRSWVSRYGNELLRSTQFVLTTISDMLSNLQANGLDVLKENEKIIINPEITKAITCIQTPKTVCQNER